MMYDAPVIKYRKDDEGKPKPGEAGFKRTSEQAEKAYEQWKKRQEEERKKGKKYDLKKFIQNGEKVPKGR